MRTALTVNNESLAAPSRTADFIELTKPRIAGMVLAATLAGFYMASEAGMDWMLLLHTLIGTAMTGGGASAINHVLEREPDMLMERTRNRPLPAGRITASQGWAFGIALSLLGTIYLAVMVGGVASFLAALSIVLYTAIYTPLKRVTYHNTVIGAVPGALPPLIGWAAAAGTLPTEAWTLFAILFFWQLPHFYAIAWMYRDDYKNGGFRMIASDDPLGERIAVRISGQILALIAASLTPVIWGMTHRAYFFIALALGITFLAGGLVMSRSKTRESARGLLLVSVIYLPLLLGALMLAKL